MNRSTPADDLNVPVGARAPQPYYPTTSRSDHTGPVYGGISSVSAHTRTVQRMMTNEVGKLLTASEVAEMLHLHVNTVKRLGDRGELPFFRVCKRGDRRFRYDDVVEFLHRSK